MYFGIGGMNATGQSIPERKPHGVDGKRIESTYLMQNAAIHMVTVKIMPKTRRTPNAAPTPCERRWDTSQYTRDENRVRMAKYSEMVIREEFLVMD
jgi:hypothetical protein